MGRGRGGENTSIANPRGLAPFTATIDFKLFPRKGGQETEDGYTIAKATDENSGKKITMKGRFGPVIEGELVKVLKYSVRNDSYGEFIQVWSVSHEDPVTRNAVIGYLQNLPGVGEKLSTEIVNQLGTDCLEKIDANPNLLLTIKLPSGHKINREDLEKVMAEWETLRKERKNMIYFSSLGINDSQAKKIVKYFAEQKLYNLEEIVKNDPYRLSVVPGIGFKSVDIIAQKMGISADDPRRGAAGIEYLLMQAENEGHVCLRPEDIYKHLPRMLTRGGVSPNKDVIDKGMQQLFEEGRIWKETGPDGEERVYTTEHFLMETRIYQHIEKRLNAPVEDPGYLKRDPESTVTDEQWEAVRHAFEQKISILTGSAGCGKCVDGRTEIILNNQPLPIQEAWHKYTGKIEADDLGLWLKLDQPLETVTVDSAGDIVPGKVTRLYKQRVNERGDYIKLASGEEIVMTKQHRLLTASGWQAQLSVGDQVATRSDGKIVYSEVVESKEIHLRQWVYDLEVETYHNYLANNIISHNTTALNEVLKQFDAKGKTYTCLAPTGKAAKRMQQATGKEASTIHRALGRNIFAPVGEDETVIDTDLVVVDEASMLNMRIAEKLMSCVSDKTNILLVGDPNQLPAIGAGSILHDLIDSQRPATTKLTKIFRQSEDSLLVVNANRIRQGKEPYWTKQEAEQALGHSVRDDWEYIESDDPETVMSKTISLSEELQSKLAIEPEQIMITAPSKKGAVGVHALNQALQDKYNPDGREIRSGEQRLREGDRVMNTLNRYQKDATVMNGEQGVVIDYLPEKKLAWVQFEDIKEPIAFTGDEIKNLIPAFAATTHKLQGSEAPVVICPLVGNNADRLLSRNMLYTAQTRGKEKCIVIGDKQKFKQALKKDGSQRETTLDLRVGEIMPRVKARWEQFKEFKESPSSNVKLSNDNLLYGSIVTSTD